jgi:hypothetical protein
MITVFIAMKQEAAPLIERLSLKHTSSQFFDTYENERIRLIITGLGKINAASAAGFCLGRYGTDTRYINYGTAAGRDIQIGKTYFAAQITDEASGKEYFPDIADHSFPHISLHSVDKPILISNSPVSLSTTESVKKSACDFTETGSLLSITTCGISDKLTIYDMEASGIFSALKNAVTPDKITIIKTVTDSGTPDFSKTKQMLESSADAVCDYVKRLSDETKEHNNNGFCVNTKVLKFDNSFIEKLCEEFKCSESMSIQLKQFIRYMDASGEHETLLKKLDDLTQKGLLPAPDRRHGKQALTILMQI